MLFRTNHRYYNGDDSYVKNLFQLDPAAPAPLQLLRYWILAWFRSKALERGPSGIKGFHRQGDLVHDLISIGADEEAVRVECRYLAKAGCILPEHLRSDTIEDSDLISITPAGYVHLELAYKDINYLAACAEDSWVEDEALAHSIRTRIAIQPYWKALSWQNTLQTACEFCQYLSKIQGRIGKRSEFLTHSTYSPAPINFEQLHQGIEQHQIRLGQTNPARPRPRYR